MHTYKALRGDVMIGPYHDPLLCGVCLLGKRREGASDTKVTQLDLVVLWVIKHVCLFDITVDHPRLMCRREGAEKLLSDVSGELKWGACSEGPM
jgi:acetyl/propionyl-CoA carboxylase alpha subunit